MDLSIKNILIVDDQCQEFKTELESSFQKDGCNITFCSSKDEAVQILDSENNFDAIILDWFLEPENDLLSKLVLIKIKETKFLPVFIWSHHVSDFQNAMDRGEVNYPYMMIQKLDKDQITTKIIMEKLQNWIKQSLSAQLSCIYRLQIKKALENIFFELSNIENLELSTLLGIIMGDGINVDWSSDFILNLLHRRLIREEEFEKDIRGLLLQLPKEKLKSNEKITNHIINKILYFFHNSIYPRKGDIIKFNFSDTNIYCMVINPDCDLEQMRSRFLEVVEMKDIDNDFLKLNNEQKKHIKKGDNPSFYFLPCVETKDTFINFVAIFKSKFRLEVIRDLHETKYPDVSPDKITYIDKFLYNGVEVKIELCCGLSEPYKSDFMSKLLFHNGRIGTPDLKKMWL